jgi:peroxiredoxin
MGHSRYRRDGKSRRMPNASGRTARSLLAGLDPPFNGSTAFAINGTLEVYMAPTTHERADGVLPAGTTAPDFTLHSAPDRSLSLKELRGRPVILAFYPADWSPVCGDQMALYNEILPDFREFGAELLGISVDGVWCHAEFARQRNLRFPLLSDFEPKGGVARLYGAYREQDGTSERALFVIDADGIIRWSYCSPIGVNPGADGILTALESLGGQPATAEAGTATRRTESDDAREARP